MRQRVQVLVATLLLALWATGASAAWVLQGHACNNGTSSSTTVTIDSRNAGLIVLFLSFFGGSPTTSNISETGATANTWALGTRHSIGCGGCNTQWAYAFNVNTGASHAITLSGAGTLFFGVCAMSFSGNDTTSPFDQEAIGSNLSSTTASSGSITPGGSGYLHLAGLGGMASATQSTAPTIDSSFTSPAPDFITWVNNIDIGAAWSYYVDAGTTTKNPTWTVSTADSNIVGAQITFKSGTGGGGGGGSPPVCQRLLLGVGGC